MSYSVRMATKLTSVPVSSVSIRRSPRLAAKAAAKDGLSKPVNQHTYASLKTLVKPLYTSGSKSLKAAVDETLPFQHAPPIIRTHPTIDDDWHTFNSLSGYLWMFTVTQVPLSYFKDIQEECGKNSNIAYIALYQDDGDDYFEPQVHGYLQLHREDTYANVKNMLHSVSLFLSRQPCTISNAYALRSKMLCHVPTYEYGVFRSSEHFNSHLLQVPLIPDPDDI